jgi:hypothetical protein
MVSESLITKETSLPDFRLENIDWKNRFVSTKTIHVDQLILVDPVDDEDLRPQTDPPNDNARSKETERIINTHPIDRSSLSYFTLALAIELIQIFLMWSQINVLSSIRLTGGQQIDFKVFSLCCRNILES